MIKFRSIGQIEKGYFFENAVAEADVMNGDFGASADGKFAVAENGTKVVMNLEVGDDEYMDEYKIPAGSHVRLVDLEKLNGQEMELYGNPLPKAVAKGDKLASDASGKLVVGASAAPYVEVLDIIGNKLGVVVKVVAE